MSAWRIFRELTLTRGALIVALILIGYFLGFMTNVPNSHSEETFNVAQNVIDKWQTFRIVFFQNLKVALMLSVFGFFSGGLLTTAVLVWNGYTMGMLIKISKIQYLNTSEMIYYQILPHALPELLSFSLFACIGLRGFTFISKLLIQSEVDNSLIPKLSEGIVPIIFLLIAGWLEAFVSQ
ncbi:MAG: stage II sporulation protein M [Cyclobacteriaceae bacterium]|nr:stage II sporulation protein M [Cyclobacteriaceae bacterium]